MTSFYNFLDEPFKPYPIVAEGRRKRSSAIEAGEPKTNDSHVERYTVEAQIVGEEANDDQQHIPADTNGDEEETTHWYDDDDDDDDGDSEQYTINRMSPKDPQSLEHSRFTLYKGIERLADGSGIPGRSCLLRSICETAEAPFSYNSGILGELAHLIMTYVFDDDYLVEVYIIY